MDDNRAATALEARAIRAYLDAVAEARERQIRDAQSQLDAATTQVDAAAVRMEEARQLYVRMQEEHRRARLQQKDAVAFLELACRPLSDDPHIRRQRGLLHPVRRLPSELFSQIFAETVASTVENGTFRAIQVQPYRLAAVCRSWRISALNTKAIWRPIRVDFGDFDHGSPHLVGLYQLYLDLSSARAGRSGIELFIARRLHADPTATSHASSGNFCVELVPHLSCLIACRSVRLLSVELPRGLKNFDILSQSAAGLEELRLINTSLETLSLPPQQWAPQLTTIAVPLSHMVQDGLTSFPSIRDATIHPRARGGRFAQNFQGDARFGLATVFTTFPNAEKFSIDLDCEQLAVANQLGHEHARSLSLVSRRGFSPLAVSYAFPALEDVTLKLHAIVVLSGVTSLLSRAFTSVRRLVLDMDIELEAVIGNALRNGLPQLVTLSCPKGIITSSFVSAFAKGDHWPCPALTSLSFLRPVTGRTAVDELGAIVAARKTARDAGEIVETFSVTWNGGRSKLYAGNDGGWVFVGGL
ncbi:hypothetical protein AURDEDRAFT_115101 [Auricularia subglabra TFB-10046 SS5]|nr:hypothetical protein AURDEDRAFT_115101 [Auricularia subglabra TFB-10046 SS5]